MKKSLIGARILNKLNYGTITFVRHFYDKIKMYQQQQPNQGQNLNKNNDASTRQQNKDDALKNCRKWIPMQNLAEKQGQIFTIKNYNILSQKLLEQHSYLYHSHDKFALRWDQRLYNVIGEIFSMNPSILCFQEVQVSHLPQIQNRLSSMNYEILFKKRTGDKPDGCAIFFNKNLFQLVEEYSVEFEQPKIEVLNRENVAIIAKLCLRSNSSIQFLVATTHLLYNPRRQDIRLAQVQILLAELNRCAQKNDENGQGTYLPIILTGDFNLQPYSAPYNLIVNGSLKYEHLTPKTLIQQSSLKITNGRKLLPPKLGISDECQHYESDIKLYHSEQRKIIHEEIELTTETVNIFQTGVLRHSFDFKSVYHHLNENYVSTHQNQWILVDYIFYSNEKKKSENNDVELQLMGYLSLPTADECENINLKIPNTTSGSDHLSLFAQFKLCFGKQSSSSTLSATDIATSTANKL